MRQLLREVCGIDSEIIAIKTAGDQFSQARIEQVGVKGVFIKEIEDALFDRRVDLAVHSLKDVPTEIPEGLTFPALPRREDPRDCLISRDGTPLAKLRHGAFVGTSSQRRQAQLWNYRPDLRMRDLRGNVDTRLKKLETGEWDAVVLAKAGLERLGRADRISEVFGPEVMLPAVGQGALGIECRVDDKELCELLARLDDADTRACVTAERALLAELQGGCQVPLGAWARIESRTLRIDAVVLSPDGRQSLRRDISGRPEEAKSLGRQLGQELLEAGAHRLLQLAGKIVGKSIGNS